MRTLHAGSSFSEVDDLSTLVFTFATNLVDIVAKFARARRKVCGSRGVQSNEVAGAGITGLEKSVSAIPPVFDFLQLTHIQKFYIVPSYTTTNILDICNNEFLIGTKWLNLISPRSNLQGL